MTLYPKKTFDSLYKILKKENIGPSLSFNVSHLVQAIRLIGKKRNIGRKKLAEELSLGEGAVRTLIKKLKAENIITTSKSGCTLTEKGLVLFNSIESKIKEIIPIEIKELGMGKYQVGVLLHHVDTRKVSRGVEQRDAAIKAGASGAITLIFEDGNLIMPTLSNLSEEYPNIAKKIISIFKPKDLDVIIIAGGEKLVSVKYGALSAALTLL